MQWPCDGPRFAHKVKDPNYGVRGHEGQIESLECPACGYCFTNGNEWPGLPAGVKFDPSDLELLEHLAAKVDPNAVKAHPFINEFIPTLNEEDGICYTHPENISGVRDDGSCAHFFHRPAKAYTTGTRKRRKIQLGNEIGNGFEMRWHKTGNTRPVKKGKVTIGQKKIMVLYSSSGKKGKPEKTKWVMHQYHLGGHEEEKEGEFVVSKVFFQLQSKESGSRRKEDADNSEHVAMEMAEQQSYSHHHSSPSTLSNSNHTFPAPPPPPKTPGPFQRQAVKQHKGLLATITEDVERLQASLSGYSHNTVQDSDQSYLAMGYESTLSCKSGSKIHVHHGSINYSAQCSPELGEKDTCSSKDKRQVGNEIQLDQLLGVVNNPAGASIVSSRSDAPSIAKKQMLDAFDSEVLKFLSSENLDITLRLQRSSDVASDKGIDHHQPEHEVKLQRGPDVPDDKGKDQGVCQCEDRDGEKVSQKADFGLENIILDTPPDFLLESFLNSQESTDWLGKKSLLNSQESTDWLGKKKFWSDSSQKTEDGSFLDFLRDSQSSV